MTTLRDEIARDAMKSLMYLFDFGTFHDDPMRLAGWAYDVADAMLIMSKEEPNKFEAYVKNMRKNKK